MNALIAYRSKYGAAALCAQKLNEKLGGKCGIVDLKDEKNPSLVEYDTVIIGGSIYAGRMQGTVSRFVEKNKAALKVKTVGLYITCLYQDDKAREELEANFPIWLTAHAAVSEWFGGIAKLGGMSKTDRFIFTRMAKVVDDIDSISEERIDKFCSVLAAR
ncbi:MAG: flavodoxin [Spirochaetales bacterium]|nr:flavodoxin [Spirochaetales bacterium]